MLRFEGPWRITVVSKHAAFDQRVVVRGPYGAKVLPGQVGASMDVDMESWGLSLEHNYYGRNWQNNLRTIPGPVTEQGGVRSQVLTSNDCHWPGKAMDYPNFVVRLEQVVAQKPERREAPGAAPVPAATQSVRTSTGSGVGAAPVAGVVRRTSSSGGDGAGAQRGTQPGLVPAWQRPDSVLRETGIIGVEMRRRGMLVDQPSTPTTPARPAARPVGRPVAQPPVRPETQPDAQPEERPGIPAIPKFSEEPVVRPAWKTGAQADVVPGVRRAQPGIPSVPGVPLDSGQGGVRTSSGSGGAAAAMGQGVVRAERGVPPVAGQTGVRAAESGGQDLGSLIERELRADGS
ncbi:hypothetical protein [Kitasatospora kifunensis]|uniref:Uncharacterized protein n=1 Tax=Kitasatospora kifunensis TaxID=58351 RepID=A0A7W7R713_KITKI|nr:hypothetical protein [Kitasatospora kifunensis]MBB4926021.1 hypothetical protein [Kitasatospora kifunensis]